MILIPIRYKSSTKSSFYITCLAVILLAASACKKDVQKTATVVINCTGTYLRVEGKEFKVCNLEKLHSYPNGTTVVATFKKLSECSGSGNFPITCFMNYSFDSWIEVEKIK